MSDTTTMPTELQPMSAFDPTQPAILHDRLNDKIVTWTGDLSEHWVEWARTERDGVVAYDGVLFDGWANVLGG
jgi:hypothetical protein